MKNTLFRLYLPKRILAIGYFSAGIICLTVLLLLLQVILLPGTNTILKAASYCTAVLGSTFSLLFVVLIGIHFIKPLFNKK